MPPPAPRPLIGVLCCNQQAAGRASQAVANRFVDPLVGIAGACVMLVPALPDAVDVARFAGTLDALLLTGGCSHLDAARYGGRDDDGPRDAGRDEVALRLADAMIARGRAVFGICRGFQELNVLFGGSLSGEAGRAGHHRGTPEDDLDTLFAHRHPVGLTAGGAFGGGAAVVNSVHHQGVDRLGGGLTVEARAHDGLVEAISARPGGARVLGVQWHPEWDGAADPLDGAFFAMLGAAARGGGLEA